MPPPRRGGGRQDRRGMITDFEALDALWPLPPEELPRQWVLTRDESSLPEEWERDVLAGWHLGYHPFASVHPIQADDGTALGWAIEPLAFLQEGRDSLIEGALRLPVAEGDSPTEIERALYGRDELGQSTGNGLAGSWVAIVFAGIDENRFGRVYLGAKHSVLYSPEHSVVATSHNLIPDVRRDEMLSRAFDPLTTNAYFTFGLTAFEGIRRLLPNHALDLGTFEPVRHWPAGAFDRLEAKDGVSLIVDHSRRLMDVLATRYRAFRVFLSAGRDSRAILSLLQPLVERGVDVRLSTTTGRDFASRVDLQAARRLARISGLPHHVKSFRQQRHSTVQDKELRRGFVRIGEARAGGYLASAAMSNKKPAHETDPQLFSLGGMAGETGRGFYWGQAIPSMVSAEDLVRRVQAPPTLQVTEAARE